MIKVAIIGCGKIAEVHAAILQTVRDCRIVGVCDTEELMAKQLYERFPVERYFSRVHDLLGDAHPDVVHITTPPQRHFDLGTTCLEAGCHIYVEKPFTIDLAQAESLIRTALRRNLLVTVGHDDQFTHAARRMRAFVNAGYLGGPPLHMESYYCYDFGDESYAKALLGDKKHWVRSLPGKLMHNIISHGVARIAEYLHTDHPEVIAYGSTSPFLRAIGETDIVDELRVILGDRQLPTAYLTSSSQMRPALHHFTVYGPRNSLILDHDNQTVIRLKGARYKSYLDKFVPPLLFAKEYVTNCATNVRAFLGRDFHMKSGMRFLIESFYRAILGTEPLPIPYREILLTARIMDDIFGQLATRPLSSTAAISQRA
jgi:predicted dehydrogenase